MSSLFFRKTSVIDHAIMGPEGIRGGSYNLNFTASLPKEKFDEEAVVVDFSSGKKEVKELIDRHVPDSHINGWDHKVWVPTRDTSVTSGDGIIRVEDDFAIISGPSDMFRFVDCTHEDLVKQDVIEWFMTQYLNTFINTDVDYQVKLDQEAYQEAYPYEVEGVEVSRAYFDYYHGLRNSSSFGCICVAHGHKSFVDVVTDPKDHLIGYDIAATIAGLLNHQYIYHKDVLHAGAFSYTTQRRGPMSYKPKVIIESIEINEEPTIENIVEWVKKQPEVIAAITSLDGPATIMISEGLQKGALWQV